MRYGVLLMLTAFASQAQSQNVALNKPYTWSTPPNYRLCTDPDDTKQLTDGRLSPTHAIWTNPATVGWQYPRYVSLTFDLGELRSIAGVSFRTAAGAAEVRWPWAILILVSDDGVVYRVAGDLVLLDQQENGVLPAFGSYTTRQLKTASLRTRGRYVQLVVLPIGPYVFCDEVEIQQGDPAWLDVEPIGPIAPLTINELIEQMRHDLSVSRRVMTDLQNAAATIAALGPAGDPLLDVAQQNAAQVPATFSTRIPFDRHHAAIFQQQAASWSALGIPDVSVWVTNPWEPLTIDKASPQPTGSISLHAMIGETRTAAINVLNASPTDAAVRVSFERLPESPVPSFIDVMQPQWIDTEVGQPIATALQPAAVGTGCRQFVARSGILTQVWLSVRTHGLSPGTHAGRVMVRLLGTTVKVPLTIRVYDIQYPEHPTLHVGGWDYSNTNGLYSLTAGNKQAVIEHLQDRGVNAPWATNAAIFGGVKWTPDGSCTLDTKNCDDWMDAWPHAATYYVFANVGTTLNGARIGTELFSQHVATWINAWAAHWQSRGVPCSKVALLLVDEVNVASTNPERIWHWANAIKTAQPDIVIWEDPYYPDVSKVPPELVPACDVICLHSVTWHHASQAYRDYWINSGKILQFYAASNYNGSVHLCDPYAYYRLQPWLAWKHRATGSHWWAFADNGGGASSWNQYEIPGNAYAPAFIDATSVTASKHMEAIREGQQDYETFVLLAAAIDDATARGVQSWRLATAIQLRDTAADEVLQAANPKLIQWHTPRDREMADTIRVRILKEIVRVRAMIP